MKRCPKCGEVKDLSMFYKNKSEKDGHAYVCGKCANEAQKIYSRTKRCREVVRKYNQTPKGKYGVYRNSAKRRGIEFSISFEYFLTFFGKECKYCGGEIKSIGIDRVDNNLGYIEGNVIPCCRICNGMKSNMDLSEFIEQCGKIYGRAKCL